MLLSPKPPYWLYFKNQKKHAFANLAKIYSVDANNPKLKEVIAEIEETIDNNQEVKQCKWRIVIANATWRHLLIGCLFNSLYRLCGISTIGYYFPIIVRISGITDVSLQLSLNITVGIVNLITTLVGTLIIDRFGRKILLVMGSILMGIAMLIIAILLYHG